VDVSGQERHESGLLRAWHHLGPCCPPDAGSRGGNDVVKWSRELDVDGAGGDMTFTLARSNSHAKKQEGSC